MNAKNFKIMKILYYSKPYFGDCDFPLIKALREQGHDVTVLYSMSPHSLKTTVFNIKKIYPYNGIFPISIYPELKILGKYTPLKDMYIANDTTGHFGWSNFKLALEVLKFFKKGNYDVIQYIETPSLFHFIPLCYFRKKLVITIHDGKPHTGAGGWKSRLCRMFSKLYTRKFIVLNKAEVDVFSKEYSVSKRKIFTSHLGYYNILHMYGEVNKRKGKYILFFGRISPYKGIEYLLKAMEIVHKKHPDVKVIIAGSGKMYFDISKYENLDYVEIRNRFIELDELADLIRGALFTVCPYTDATQSGVVYSSFALNTPVIATKVGGLPEMIDDGETGIIVPPKDVNALASAILSYLNNPELLKKMNMNIAESAKSGNGSWDIIAEEYISIYKKNCL